jgi:predicted esterase YcpF (UPF0227 family)
MKFKQYRQPQNKINYEVIIYTGNNEIKVHHDTFPILKGKTIKHYDYYGLLTKQERLYYDNIIKLYGDYNIIDKDIDHDFQQIFIYLNK